MCTIKNTLYLVLRRRYRIHRHRSIASHAPSRLVVATTSNTWSEQQVDRLGENAWKRVGMTREKTLRRLEQYMKQGMSKSDALQRLNDSLQSNSGPANPGKLAIMNIDD